MYDRAQLAALSAVVDTGSFESAARELHLTPSAVSQRVRSLENVAGAVLVRRTRPCVATSAGEHLVRLARQVAELEADTEAVLHQRDVHATLPSPPTPTRSRPGSSRHCGSRAPRPARRTTSGSTTRTTPLPCCGPVP
jgi:DNA-binding transcriptional LysR family regulator